MNSGKKDRERAKEKGRERGIWDWHILLSGEHRTPRHLSTILRVLLHMPAATVIRAGGTVGSPPSPITYTPFQQFEARAVDLEDSL
jgi:hypothetical protein